MYLIDWEYAGMADPGCDIGTFIACSDYTPEEAGTYDVALRVYPSNPHLPHRMDFALVKWA